MLFQLKQIGKLNKGRVNMAIPPVEEFLHVGSYPLLEFMDFDTDILMELQK